MRKRMAYTILYTPEFKRDYKKLPIATRKLLKAKGMLLAQDPHHPFLKTHKLSGALAGRWACSVDYRHRIIFRFMDNTTIVLLRVGDHSLYKKELIDI